MQTHRAELHQLRTQADRLVHAVLPWNGHESRDAIERFLDLARSSSVAMHDMEATLLQCASALDRHLAGVPAHLVERLLVERSPWMRHDRETLLRRFADCLEGVAKRKDVGHRGVNTALAFIDRHYRNPALSPSLIANHLEIRPSSLSAAFELHARRSCSECIREVRLERAAHLLRTTHSTVKEVWAAVGYNDNSNFR